MKKLMIVGLVAACACVAEAGIFTNFANALAGKATGVQVAGTTAKALDVGTVDLMSLNEREFTMVLEQADTKAKRKSLLKKLHTTIENWEPKSKIGAGVRRVALKVVEGLHDADLAIRDHWRHYVAPTLKKAWASIKDFFGGIGK